MEVANLGAGTPGQVLRAIGMEDRVKGRSLIGIEWNWVNGVASVDSDIAVREHAIMSVGGLSV